MESWLPWLVDDELLITNVLPDTAKVVLVEPRRMRDRADDLLAEEDDLARSLASTWARDADRTFPRLHATTDRLLASGQHMWTISSTPSNPDAPMVQATGWGPVVGDGEGLALRLKEMLVDQYRIVVAADGAGSAQRLTALLRDRGLDFTTARDTTDLTRPAGTWSSSPLHRGFSLPVAKLAVVAEGDLTGRRRTHRQPRPRKRQSAGFFEDLKPGNYVVHHQHGVGQYEGMVKRTIGGIERDYLLLAYKGGDKLYVPSDQIDVLRQYVGGETPSLHRLGGADFAKAKSRVRSAVREIAQELVVLYQKRVNATGHAFGHDTPWQHEMEEAFPYAETPDQQKAIDDVKVDMERAYPMDRLVCGDVGFGKTEVAIRAAFKAIQDGKQVAVLAPTTLLATQHGNTFADRFAGFPIRVEVLSRFLTAKQARHGDRRVEERRGRLRHRHPPPAAGLGQFKDLGLLVVDEEQRFGVQAKEAMKKMKTNVDVLTLSATPIPRTLEMSLVGIRDLSLLQTPPADRQPILTFVGEYDERVAVEAIRRELLREGQVFWVHNRVNTIDQAADPAARAGARGPHRHRPRADGRGLARADRGRLLGGSLRRAGVHHHHRERHRHAHGEHPGRRARRPAGVGADAPVARPRGPQRIAGLRLSVPPAATPASPKRPTSGCAPSARPPTSAAGSRSPCATSRSVVPATCWASRRAATSPPSATTCTARW